MTSALSGSVGFSQSNPNLANQDPPFKKCHFAMISETEIIKYLLYPRITLVRNEQELNEEKGRVIKRRADGDRVHF